MNFSATLLLSSFDCEEPVVLIVLCCL